MSILIRNRKAQYDYLILEIYEAGIILTGKEVKSLRNKMGKLEGSYCYVSNDELYILNFNIPVYQPKNIMGEIAPDRTRKLLLKRKEINYLIGKLREKGFSLIPLRAYLKNNRIKLALGLAKGKSRLDKRETIKKRDIEREMKQNLKTLISGTK
ncbi:MAG: SsrA-binding protein SmpB [Candidatus Moranbacteria bacterium]|nr:SsrA-binding protein SmpB [Candidatus Moranbacteria bacterium]